MGTEPEAVCGDEKPAMTRRRAKTHVGKTCA
jgi:hypothetical protein